MKKGRKYLSPTLNDPTPLKPYSERKDDIIRFILARHNQTLYVSSRWRGTAWQAILYKDLLRMEKAGILKRQRTPFIGKNRTYFTVVNPPIKPEPRVVEPYKKRNEALKEFAELNGL